MAIFNVSELNPKIREMKTYSDPETGCYSYNDQQAFESCKQTYYLKKQNEILSQQENNFVPERNNIDQKDIELMKSQIETMQQKIELQQKKIIAAKTQQDVQISQKDNIFFTDLQSMLALCLLVILIVGFVAGILFAKKIMNK
ncbi:MAG: hypothetical protein U9O55_02610 [Patescibacteria group bacterium]|nr:hypothetical protein [Patescibacteria group bacterium]